MAFELRAGQKASHLHCLVIVNKMLAIYPPIPFPRGSNGYAGTLDMMSALCLGPLRGHNYNTLVCLLDLNLLDCDARVAFADGKLTPKFLG